MFKSFEDAKEELEERRKLLKHDIKENNKKYGKKFHSQYGDELLELSGLRAYQVIISHNPECCVCSDLRINIRVTEEYEQTHGEEKILESGKEYLSFDLSNTPLYGEIESIIGEDFALRYIFGDDFWIEDFNKSFYELVAVQAG